MDVYVDSSVLSKDRPIGDCIRSLLGTGDLLGVRKIVDALRARARCRQILWVERDASYCNWELCQKIYSDKANTGTDVGFAGLSEREQRDLQALANALSTGFRKIKALHRNVLDVASRNVALVWKIAMNPRETIEDYSPDRQVVIVPESRCFDDDAVCRVLYCNHPEVPENSANRGYVSQSHENKHFLVTNNDVAWKANTDIVNSRYGEKVSKFCPGIKFGEDGYASLERSALKDAMQAGKYSLAKMSRHVYAHGEQIGASEGEMTCKVRIEASNRDVHVYPVPEATPVG